MKKKLGATLLTLMLPLTAVETKRIPRSSHPPSLDHQLHAIATTYGPYSIMAISRSGAFTGVLPPHRQEPPTPRTKVRLIRDLQAISRQHSVAIRVVYGTPPPLGDSLRAG